MTRTPLSPPHAEPSPGSPSTATTVPRPWPLEPMPVSVWPCSPLRSCPTPSHRAGFGEPPCAWRWPADMWAAVIRHYAQPGDRVLISDAGPALPAVRAALDHGCTVVARVPSRVQRIGVRLDLNERTTRRRRHRDVVLFGGRSGPGPSPRSHRPLPVTWPARARRTPADLMIIPPPCPDETAIPTPWTCANEGRRRPVAAGHSWVEAPVDPVLRWQRQLIRDSLALLRPGGVVALLTRNTPHPEGMVDRLRPLTADGQQLGLTYLQHNVLVHATITGDRLLPASGADDRARSVDLTTPAGYATWMRLGIDRHPIPEPGATHLPEPQPGEIGPAGEPLLHMPVHTDLVVFTVPYTAAASSAATAPHYGAEPEGAAA